MTTISMSDDEMLAIFMRSTCSEEEIGMGLIRRSVYSSRFESYTLPARGMGPCMAGGDVLITEFNTGWDDECEAPR